MNDIAVHVQNLSKQYHLGAAQPRYRTIRDSIADVVAAPLRRLRNVPSETIWALKDVSFEVERGEVVGIIGRNGAGKSTLLKILSRITEPTAGRAEVHGRLGSLLEVGTGFHPELTGRENIYLNGAILGMRRAEIECKFDEIAAFAEIEKFLDTPVKHYSSGMHVRLAFAVAAHLESEVLLVDEVLAVGDAVFQKKCLGKIGEVARGGRTVLLVSHNMGAISRLCERALWLDGGHIVRMGPTHEIIHDYLSTSASTSGNWTNSFLYETEPDTKLLSASIITLEGFETGVVRFDEDFNLILYYELLAPIDSWLLVFRVDDSSGTVVFSSWDTDFASYKKPTKIGKYRAACHMPGKLLRPGTYSVSLAILSTNLGPNLKVLERHEPAFNFEVSNLGCTINPGRLGVITPVLKWSIEKFDS